MGVVKNVIETLFTSSGASKVTKDTDSVNRAQTRLGQSSVNNARQFAAQSQGLGGLVAAYAGAAATIFTVQAAFEALSKAAQADTIVRGTSALAAMTSQSGPRIIKTIQEITDGQLTMTEAAQNANIALSAGFNTSQIEQFSKIAQKASQALGRDFTDSLQRVVRGVSKLEPELLDELGIFTRIEPAVQAYARTLGISASSLSEFQRRQAFANAAIEEGNRKFSSIDTSSDSLQKTLEQLRVRITELSTSFLQGAASALSPFISLLTNDVGNSLLAFGALLALVFGKTTEIVGTFITKKGQGLAAWADSVADRAKLATAEVEALKKAVTAPLKGAGGGLSGITTKAKAGQDAAQAKRFAEALELQKTAGSLLPSQLNKINQAYKEQVQALTDLGLTGSKTFQNLNAAIARNEQVLRNSSKQVSVFIGLSNTMKAGAALLTVGVEALSTAISRIFFGIGILQLVGTLFDVDLLGAIIGMFKDMSKAAEELTKGFYSLTVAAAGGGAELTKSLTIAGATEKDIQGFADRVADLRDYAKALADMTANMEKYNTVRPGMIFEPATTADNIKILNKLLRERQDIVESGPNANFLWLGTSQKDVEQARLDIIAIDLILKSLQNESEKTSRVITQLSSATGLSGETVATLLADEIKNTSKEFKLFGIQLEEINGSYSLENVTDSQLKLLEAVILSRNGIKDLYSSIESGNITLTTAGSAIAGLESKLLEILAVTSQLTNIDNSRDEDRLRAQLGALDAEAKALENTLTIFRKVEAALKDSEDVYKSITSTFSKDISTVDTAAATGLVDTYGKVAVTQAEIEANQAKFLRNIIDSTAYTKDLVGDQQKLNDYIKANAKNEGDREIILATVSKNYENYEKALRAVEGRLINVTKQAYEAAQSFRELNSELQVQLSDIARESNIASLQFDIDMTALKAEGERAAAAFQETFLQNQIRISDLEVDLGKKTAIAGAEDVNQLESQILAAKQAGLEAERIAAAEIWMQEAVLLEEKKAAAIDVINIEAQQTKAKIEAEYKVLMSAASTYSAISGQMSTAIISGANSAGQALVDAAYAAAKTLASAFGGPIGALLGIGSNIKKESFAAQPLPQTGVVNTPSGPQNVITDPGLLAALTDANGAYNDSLKSSEAVRTASIEAAEKATAAERKLLDKRYAEQVADIQRRTDLTEQEKKIAALEAEKRLAEAKKAGGGGGGGGAGEAEITALEQKLKSLFDAVKGSIESALTSLNALVFYGEGSFGEIASKLFRSIQEDFFRITITEPLSEQLTTSIFSALGVDMSAGVKKGTKGLTYQGNSLLVRVTNLGDFGVNKLFDKDQKDTSDGAASTGFFGKIGSWFTNLFGQGGFISKLFSGLFGQGGILSGLFKGILGLFGFGGFAQGGLVHLAQGGAATASALRRDRIPAMLEPGEFVIRRPAARAIGVPALQSLNATGQTSSGAPIININNNGTPKDVQTSEPRFDGEKYVIDIVMRDIANNGPIRRSLRGRGGL